MERGAVGWRDCVIVGKRAVGLWEKRTVGRRDCGKEGHYEKFTVG